MWDSHFRVGGAIGSNLQLHNCPKLVGFIPECMAASLILHLTQTSSGYFENVWAWVADHDIDVSLFGATDSSASQVSIYSGRGILIESQGPTWLYGTASEHSILYQYQLLNANNVGTISRLPEGFCSNVDRYILDTCKPKLRIFNPSLMLCSHIQSGNFPRIPHSRNALATSVKKLGHCE